MSDPRTDIYAWQSEERRPTWDENFMMHAEIAATRCTCDRGPSQRFSTHKGIGAAIVSRDHRRIAMGYAGSPPGLPHCDDVGHEIIEGTSSCVRTIHAEENAILNATFGLRGCTIYSTAAPCYNCAKRIISSGIVRVVYQHEHKPGRKPSGFDIFKSAGIRVDKLSMETGELITEKRS